MTSHLFNARDAARAIVVTWEGHRAKVASGECVQIDGRAIHITEHIDRTLRKEVDSYLNASVRAIKEGAQRLTKYLSLDIGFLFMKQTTFEGRVAALESSNPELAAYLQQTASGRSRSSKAALHSNMVAGPCLRSPTRLIVLAWMWASL